MSYLGVLALAVVNGVVLYFAAFLAAGGDGRSDGIKLIWLAGFVWIALLTVVALVLCARKKATAGLILSFGTLPSAYVAGIAAIALASAFTSLRPASSELAAACKSSGARFLSPPVQPVHTLAYEWGGKNPVDINYFRIDARNNVLGLGTRHVPYPAGVRLVDNQLSTADVLVTFAYPIGKDELLGALSDQGLVGYQVTVVDQRDGRTLAVLNYFTELSKNKACGPTSDGELNVDAFVMKAIGVS